MSRNRFTEEQLQQLRDNPYVYSVTPARLQLTKEFKEIFLASYNAGELPRKILEDYGFPVDLIGERRIWSISLHIRDEYAKYGEFHEGYRNQFSKDRQPDPNKPPDSEKEQLKQLEHKVDYLTQEVEFLKKISSIRTTRK